MKKKILIGSIFAVALLLLIPSIPAIQQTIIQKENQTSNTSNVKYIGNGRPDLKIHSYSISYLEMPPNFRIKLIECQVENVGDASLDFINVHGEAQHVLLRFIHSVERDKYEDFTNNSWEPGEIRTVTTLMFPRISFPFLVDNGFFRISMEIIHPDDPNPDNNQLEGYFFIYDDTIKDIYIL
jgi:hypothetical protein